MKASDPKKLHDNLLRDLADLKLARIAATYQEVLDEAARNGSSCLEVLATLATALIDRLMHHEEALVIEGESYRTRDKTSDPET